MFEQTVDIERIEQIINLFGNFDENIKRIEKKYRVSITSHGSQIRVRGDVTDVMNAVRTIEGLLVMINKGEQITDQSIDYVSGGLDRTLEQVPAEKVVNALPFYTRLWMTKGAEVTSEAIPISNVEECLQKYGKSMDMAEWDEVTCQNYIEWQGSDTLYQMWIEDTESLGVKVNVMNARNIGGVAVWRLGYGTQSAWELVAAYAGVK